MREGPMTYHIWVPVLVFAACFGGVLAYTGATPKRVNDPAIAVSGAWSAATPQRIERSMNAAGAVWKMRWERTASLQRGRAAANAWLTALPQDARGHSGRGRFEGRRADGSVLRTATWLGGLPAARVEFRLRAAQVTEARGHVTEVSVPVTVAVRLGSNLRAPGTLGSDRTVVLRGSPVDQQNPSRTRWRVQRVTGGPSRRGITSLTQPRMYIRDGVTVLAEAAHERDAVAYAGESARSMRLLESRYRRLAGARHAEIVLVMSTSQARRVTGGDANAPAGVTPAGWTRSDGLVVLVQSELGHRSSREQLGVVRHELTHVVTTPLLKHASTMVLEGLATWEETQRVTSGSTEQLDLSELRAAFRDGSIDYDNLLHSNAEFFGLDTPDLVTNAYLAGYATVGYIERKFGHDRLMDVLVDLRTGHSIDRAISDRLHLSGRQLESGVRVWVADQVRIAGAARRVSTDENPGNTAA